MDKFVIIFVVLSSMVITYASEISVHDYDIQIHPIHGHGHGDEKGFATSVRYDKRYHHKEPVAEYHEAPVAEYHEAPIAEYHEAPIAEYHEAPVAEYHQAPVAEYHEDPVYQYVSDGHHDEGHEQNLGY